MNMVEIKTCIIISKEILIEDLLSETKDCWLNLTYELRQLKPEYEIRGIKHIRSYNGISLIIDDINYSSMRTFIESEKLIKLFCIKPSSNLNKNLLNDNDFLYSDYKYGELINLGQYARSDFDILFKFIDETYECEKKCMKKFHLPPGTYTFVLPIMKHFTEEIQIIIKQKERNETIETLI